MTKLSSFSIVAGLAASSTLGIGLLLQAPVQAASFTAQDASTRALCVGQASCTIDNFFKLTTAPAGYQITEKKVKNIWGFGIAKDASKPNQEPSQGEIDFNETLNVAFESNNVQKTGILKSLQLSFLYQPDTKATPGYADQVYEMALVTANGSTQRGTLQVTGTGSAIWRLDNLAVPGAVTKVSNSQRGADGSYTITNPFGDLRIKGFSLTALKVPKNDKTGVECTLGSDCPAQAKNSDFTLTSVDVEKVPEPATLLGLGVVGLLAVSRRRTTKFG